MINCILSDLSRVVLNSKDKEYVGTLNALYKSISAKPDFNFNDHFELNEDILKFYELIKRSKVSVNLFTTGTIQDAPEIKERLGEVFDKIFSAEDWGLDKKDPHAYAFIAEKLGVPSSQILYIDDQLENVEAARQADFNTIQYQEFQKLKDEVKEYLNV